MENCDYYIYLYHDLTNPRTVIISNPHTTHHLLRLSNDSENKCLQNSDSFMYDLYK